MRHHCKCTVVVVVFQGYFFVVVTFVAQKYNEERREVDDSEHHEDETKLHPHRKACVKGCTLNFPWYPPTIPAHNSPEEIPMWRANTKP